MLYTMLNNCFWGTLLYQMTFRYFYRFWGLTGALITSMSEEEKVEIPKEEVPTEEKLEKPEKRKREFKFTAKRQEAFEKCRQKRQEAIEQRKQLASEGKARKMTERAEFQKAWMNERKRKNHPPVEELEAMLYEEHKEGIPPARESSPAPRQEPPPEPMEQGPTRDELIQELHMMVGDLFDQRQEEKNRAREKAEEVSKRTRQEESVYTPPSARDMFIFV